MYRKDCTTGRGWTASKLTRRTNVRGEKMSEQKYRLTIQSSKTIQKYIFIVIYLSIKQYRKPPYYKRIIEISI